MTNPRVAERPRGAVVAALVAVQLFFGLHYLAAKLLLAEIEPRAWAGMRIAAGAILLLAAARLAGRRLGASRRDLALLGLFALLGVAINQLCFVEGLSRTTPTHSSLINTTIPVATLVFSAALGAERLQAKKLAAIALAFAGLLLVVRPFGPSSQPAVLAGDLLTLVNALSYSAFLALSRGLMQRLDPLAATAALLGMGALIIAPVAVPAILRTDWTAIAPATWGLAAFIIVFPTAGAYLLINWALARVESSLVAFFIYLQPLIATLLSVVLLGERPHAAAFAGAALIFAGVGLALLRPRG